MFGESKEEDLTRARLRSLLSSDSKELDRSSEELKGSKYKPRLPVPIQTPIDKLFDTSKERALYDEMLGPILKPRPLSSSNMTASRPVVLKPLSDVPATNTENNGSSTGDFTTAILRRLTLAEETEKILRRQLAEVIMKNEVLQRENDSLRSIDRNAKEMGLYEEINQLKEENFDFQRQVMDMEQFLRDYGLEWVGHKSSESDEKEEAEDGSQECFNAKHLGSYQTFVSKVEELNSLIQSEPVQIKKDDVLRRARFVYASEATDNISITFYKNGLLVKRGPFRLAGSPGYVNFCRDIFDGYFPSEFKGEYPEGVIFTLVDRRTHEYGEAESVGQTLSFSDFSSRLPEKVVKNGEIFNVKKNITAMLEGPQEDAGNIDRDVPMKRSSVLDTVASRIDPSSSSVAVAITTVQIKWIDGKEMLLAKMFEDDLVFSLKDEIMKHFGGALLGCPLFELRSAYPPRKLRDDMTLIEAGLTPNGTVHAKRLA